MKKNIITIPKESSMDLAVLSKIIKDIGGKGGCQACCSGDPFELRFEELTIGNASSGEMLEEKFYKYNKETQKVEEITSSESTKM